MKHPDWASKFKKKGTELRFINGRYYLYRISSVWDKEKNRSRKITHEMIGRITEIDGLILRGTKKEPKKIEIKNLYVKEYAASHILKNICFDIVQILKNNFSNYWREILVLAINRLLYQAPLKNMDFLYQESFLSVEFEGLNLTKNFLTKFIHDIGTDREKVSDFLKKFVDGCEHLVFDTTHIVSQSQNMKMNEVGYNSLHSFDPQVNLFYFFSVDQQMPVYYRIFPGNIAGMSALKLCVLESKIKSCTVIGDKGFFSDANMKSLEEASLKFILPLKRDSNYIDYCRLNDRNYEKAFDGHFFYQERVIFFYNIKLKNEKNVIIKNVIVFLDPKLRLEEEKSYLKRIKEKYTGYTIENYQLKQNVFGTISMITNLVDTSPQKIYENYKSRMEIETVFDTYKNLIQADRTYMQSNDSINGWLFINHIATMMYYKIFNLIKKCELLSHLSPKDLFTKLIKINKIKINDTWHLAEINTQSQKLFKKLSLHIT